MTFTVIGRRETLLDELQMRRLVADIPKWAAGSYCRSGCTPFRREVGEHQGMVRSRHDIDFLR